jgi:hypothetical protein
MFTVRHLEGNGDESIFSASHLSVTQVADERRRELTAFAVGPGAISGDGNNRYANGTIYVMNASGKTVGVYDLDQA